MLAILAVVGCAKRTEPASVGSAAPSRMDDMAYAPESMAAPPPPPPPPPMTEAAPSDQREGTSTVAKAEARMVHYAGYARLRVTRIGDALDAIAAEAVERGGRVEQLTKTAITVRVPAASFDSAWAEIRAMGDVLDESVTAEDVTESFLAVDLRVRTLTVTRDRLVALLARAESEEEKIALLRELQRVTESLDAFERQRRMLRGLADFSRISVDLVPRDAAGGSAAGPAVAGFEWVEGLSPFHRALGAGDRRVRLPVPEGMVALSPKGQFVAESPEGAASWTARVPNDPQASADFWIDAVVDRLAGDFASAERSTRGPWSCVTLVDGSDAPYTWDVCAQADPADRFLLLAQAYYPDAAAAARYLPAVAAALVGGGS